MQRILVVENDLLLGAAVQILLADEGDLDVIGISSFNEETFNEETFVQEFSRLQPDVIVLDEASCLASPPKLQTLIDSALRVQILVISANHDLIRIYDKREIELCQITDLFNIIRENSFSDR